MHFEEHEAAHGSSAVKQDDEDEVDVVVIGHQNIVVGSLLLFCSGPKHFLHATCGRSSAAHFDSSGWALGYCIDRGAPAGQKSKGLAVLRGVPAAVVIDEVSMKTITATMVVSSFTNEDFFFFVGV